MFKNIKSKGLFIFSICVVVFALISSVLIIIEGVNNKNKRNDAINELNEKIAQLNEVIKNYNNNGKVSVNYYANEVDGGITSKDIKEKQNNVSNDKTTDEFTGSFYWSFDQE